MRLGPLKILSHISIFGHYLTPKNRKIYPGSFQTEIIWLKQQKTYPIFSGWVPLIELTRCTDLCLFRCARAHTLRSWLTSHRHLCATLMKVSCHCGVKHNFYCGQKRFGMSHTWPAWKYQEDQAHIQWGASVGNGTLRKVPPGIDFIVWTHATHARLIVWEASISALSCHKVFFSDVGNYFFHYSSVSPNICQ